MADVIAVPTFDTQVERLRACVMEHDGNDSFRMRVHRRSEIIATFEGARVEHFVMPETWIPMLCGGGQFMLAAFHDSNPNAIVATLVPGMISGPARDLDVGAPSKPGWQGPPTMTFPKPAPQPQNGAASFFDKPGGGGSSASPRDPSATAPSSGPSAEFIDMRLRIIETQSKAAIDEIRHTLDASAKAAERQAAQMMEIVKAVAHRPPEPARPSLADQVTPLITALTPIVAAIIGQSAADKKAALEASARAEERAAAAQAESTKMLLTMSERSAGAAQDSMKMMSPIVDAVTTMGRAMLQQVATMQELSAPASEANPWVDFGRDIARAAAEYFASHPGPQPGQRQLPPAAAATVAGGTAPPPAPAQPAAQPAESAEGATPEQIAVEPPDALASFLTSAITAKEDPAVVADGYVQMQVNKGFVEMVGAAGGPLKFFQARLGDAWVAQNADYVRSVVSALMQLGVKVA